MVRILGVVALALSLGGCRIINNNTNQGGNGGAGGSGGSGPTSPSPVPNPTPSQSSGPRTPDPAAGQILPLPSYGAQVVAATDAANPGLVQASCSSFAFLDRVVDALRQRDARWGYNCKRGNCNDPSTDAVAYHATAGQEVTGVTGVYVVDVIRDVCGLSAVQYINLGFAADGAWTSRGRF